MEQLYTIYIVEVSPTYLNLTKTNQNWRVILKSLSIQLTHSPYLTYLLNLNQHQWCRNVDFGGTTLLAISRTQAGATKFEKGAAS